MSLKKSAAFVMSLIECYFTTLARNVQIRHSEFFEPFL